MATATTSQARLYYKLNNSVGEMPASIASIFEASAGMSLEEILDDLDGHGWKAENDEFLPSTDRNLQFEYRAFGIRGVDEIYCYAHSFENAIRLLHAYMSREA